MYVGATVVGIYKLNSYATSSSDRDLHLNPPMDLVLEEGDEVIVIAEDDDTYGPVPEMLYSPDELQLKCLHNEHVGHNPSKADRKAEKLLFIGWRRDVRDMINILDCLCVQGSELVIFCSMTEAECMCKLEESGLDVTNLQNITLKHEKGNSTNRKDLEKLELHKFCSILILADEEYENSESVLHREVYADSRALSCLLIVRSLQKSKRRNHLIRKRSIQHNCSMDDLAAYADVDDTIVASDMERRCSIISEILDVRTRTLIAEASATDYVASNELLSKALSMVAEQREVYGILSEIFSARGHRM